jgi:4-hydroxy-tetrahydrodipicolinate synthase
MTSPGEFRYRGVLPILPTPFREDDRIDFDSLGRLLDFLALVGVDGVTVLGVLGEGSALTDHEAREVVRFACGSGSGLPVIAGASRQSPYATRAMAEFAAEAGAAAVMVAPPSVEGISQDAIWGFFAEAASGPLPLIVQDHPASSRVQMPAALLARMIEELPAVAGLKCESVPAGPKIRAIRERMQRVPMLTGLGALYAATDLAAGADGFNTGFAFPEVLQALLGAAQGGDAARVLELYHRFLPFIVFEQHPGPAIRKEVWRHRGILTSPRVRPPAPQLDPWMASQLEVLLEDAFPGTDLTAPVKV